MPQTTAIAKDSSPEVRLHDHLVRIDRMRSQRVAVHIHISRLQPEHRREFSIRIARRTFENIAGQYEGDIFVLGNNDIVFVGKDVQKSSIERSIERLRSLFSEDPLVYASNPAKPAFCTWYEMETQYDQLFALSKAMLKQAALRAENSVDGGLSLLDAKSLSGLVDILSTADISNFVRNQTACLKVKNVITPIFDELYVSITDLQRTLIPNNDLRGDHWLFQYVTEVLDKRMFAYLDGLERKPDRVFSINLNISTILSPEFQAYDEALATASRGGNMVIEVQKHDIFADMGAFSFAQEYLRERTHKLCLDGITHLTLPFIDREQLKLDLVKLCWSPELIGKRDRILPGLKSHIDRIGPQRFIMIHCDTPDAIEIGHELGISLFQGRYITHLLHQSRNKPKQVVAN